MNEILITGVLMNNSIRKINILIDKTIGEFIFFILKFFYWNNKKTNINEVRHILLIRPGGIGDFLLNIPTFKRLRKMYPHAKITLLLFKRNKHCIELYSDFDSIRIIDEPLEFIWYLIEKKDYDLCIDFDQHRKIPSIIAMLSNARVRIGFRNNGKEAAYNYPINYYKGRYEAQSFLDLLRPLGSLTKLSEKELYLIDSHSNTNRRTNRVGIYAAAMKLENRFPLKAWRDIIKKLGKNNIYYFIGSKEDKARYDALENELGNEFKIIRIDGKTSLKECFEVLQTLDLCLAEDGGIYHLAVCAGIPTVFCCYSDTLRTRNGNSHISKWKAPFRQHKEYKIKMKETTIKRV